MADKKTEYSKWKSRRWIITVWAMIVITGIIIGTVILDNDCLVSLATLLISVPVAYTSLETLNKKKQIEVEHEHNKETTNTK